MRKIIVVREPKDWRLDVPGVEIVGSKEYLTDPAYSKLTGVRVWNLARHYSYQSRGYYVSLLAEARGQKVIPSAKTILDLQNPTLVRVVGKELEAIVQQSLADRRTDEFVLNMYFGRTIGRAYDKLAHALYQVFQSPLLRARFTRNTKGQWELRSARPISHSEIPPDHLPYVKRFAAEYFAKRRYHHPPQDRTQYDLAILVDANDKAVPSNKRAVVKFRQAAEQLGFAVDIIGPGDLDRLGQYDALLIRVNTHVNDHSYRFARKAQKEGLAVIDAPDAILKCNNKVYLTELMQAEGIPQPSTLIVHSDNRKEVSDRFGLPVVLKLPDSTFSIGVLKAHTTQELHQHLDRLLESSELVIAQEYLPTDFDWRVGVLDGQALFACKYFMARGHWQIYNWASASKRYQSGDFATLPLDQVPPGVLQVALRAARAVSPRGLFGVDVKEVKGKPYVIEVNENPNVDAGVEDLVLGDELYTRVITSLKRCIEEKIGVSASSPLEPVHRKP
jgi:glutathione synthase/RimK-type ligase-like ATP-grasp enzyme